jgi:hypothetical protein
MVVTARRDKGCLIAKALRQLEAQNAAVKLERPVKVRDFQMHMSDPNRRIDGMWRQRLLARS